ncbi:hypothetical protein KC351_g35 [Hortaea werneckii]|nr:hypothetical protein KC351_g35 [Hortaea werneckii]
MRQPLPAYIKLDHPRIAIDVCRLGAAPLSSSHRYRNVMSAKVRKSRNVCLQTDKREIWPRCQTTLLTPLLAVIAPKLVEEGEDDDDDEGGGGLGAAGLGGTMPLAIRFCTAEKFAAWLASGLVSPTTLVLGRRYDRISWRSSRGSFRRGNLGLKLAGERARCSSSSKDSWRGSW